MADCLEFNIKEICAKYIGVAVLLAGLISPCLTASQHNSANKDLWQNPCSYQPLIRHGRSAAKIQTNTIIKKIDDSFFKRLKELYPKAEELEKPSKFRMRANNCPRINRMLKPIKNASDEFQAHSMFYKSLYQIAFFTDSLKNLNIKTSIVFDRRKRKEIYEGTKEYLKLALCEAYDIVEPFVLSHNPPPKSITKCLPKTASLGNVQDLDIQFFKKLKKFFKQGRKLMRRFNRNKKHQNKLRTHSS